MATRMTYASDEFWAEEPGEVDNMDDIESEWEYSAR